MSFCHLSHLDEYVIFNPKLNPHEAVPFDEPAVELGNSIR